MEETKLYRAAKKLLPSSYDVNHTGKEYATSVRDFKAGYQAGRESMKEEIKALCMQFHKDGYNQGIVTTAKGIKEVIEENPTININQILQILELTINNKETVK